MDKTIPTLFDVSIIDTSLQDTVLSNGNSSLNRIKVRAFTKYANRNGSYITDEVAGQLISSATQGDTPVIGFFDPETSSWASHTGPTLASAYGYVENFLGWEPFTDTDGVQRDYAVFSVVLFTKYYEEAKKILGQNQSMELDINSIDGDWANIEGQDVFVYTRAKILGFCVIGSHEPCFSVSAFFAKKDENELHSLLNEFKLLVKEVKNNSEGGDDKMEEFENKEEVIEVEEENNPSDENSNPAPEFEVEEQEVQVENESQEEVDDTSITEFENLKRQFEELQASYNELQNSFEAAQQEIEQMKNEVSEIETLRAENTQLHTAVASYEAMAAERELELKNQLIEKYEKMVEEEEINIVRTHINDFSYDEIESKLAISFANHQIASEQEIKKVPLPEPQESQFALLMKKYRKN